MYPPVLTRALTYPYPRPTTSYLFSTTAPHIRPLPASYTPPCTSFLVISIGSNGSPDQLLRKYHKLTNLQIPVIRVNLHNFDIVYAMQIAPYGSIPSQIVTSPGTIVKTHALVLTSELLNMMHKTESTYCFCRLKQGEQFATFVDAVGGFDEKIKNDLYCYVGMYGAVKVDGDMIGMKEMMVCGRERKEMWQEEIQKLIRDRTRKEVDLDTFIRENCEKEGMKKKVLSLAKVGDEEMPLEGCWHVVQNI